MMRRQSRYRSSNTVAPRYKSINAVPRQTSLSYSFPKPDFKPRLLQGLMAESEEDFKPKLLQGLMAESPFTRTGPAKHPNNSSIRNRSRRGW